jgi:hypothetical protein
MKMNRKNEKGDFWIKDAFIREYAKNLSPYAQIVYVALCCHANSEHITFIGCRRIGKLLNINKNTVSKKIKELEVYGYVIRLDKKIGQPSHIKINTVPNEQSKPSQQGIHKECIKEYIKEGAIDKKHPYRGRELMLKEFKKTNLNSYKKLYKN